MKNELADAMNEVRDAYILAAARPRARRRWIPAAAAVLAVVMAAGVVAHSWEKPPVSMEQPSVNATVSAPLPTEATQPTQTYIQSAVGVTYWATSVEMGYESLTERGVVTISKYLARAMEDSSNPKDLFAVSLEETTGVEKEVLYKEIILPLGAKEEFMGKGVVYLTEEQIEALKCPEEMSIVLKLQYQYDVLLIKKGECQVPKDYFDKLVPERVDLAIIFKASGEFCDNRPSAESCSFDAIKEDFLKEYGIPEEAWEYTMHGYRHFVNLWDVDVELLSGILEDPRIQKMWDMYSHKYPWEVDHYTCYWKHETE